MKIVLPVKQVPETKSVRMDEKTGTVIREGVEAIVNPLDLYAIEAALQLAGRFSSKTCAVSMGPAKAIEAVREAVSMGIEEALLLSDKAFAGSDTWATSYVLAQAIRPMQPDLIICGERATDGDTGQVGPGIAAWLNLPVATYVSRIDTVDSDTVTVHRLIEDGYEVLRVNLPCVLTVVKEVGEPRLPTLDGKIRARRAQIEQLDADALGIDVSKTGLKGSPTRVVRIFKPKVTRTCEMLTAPDETSVQTAAGRVREFLADKELI